MPHKFHLYLIYLFIYSGASKIKIFTDDLCWMHRSMKWVWKISVLLMEDLLSFLFILSFTKSLKIGKVKKKFQVSKRFIWNISSQKIFVYFSRAEKEKRMRSKAGLPRESKCENICTWFLGWMLRKQVIPELKSRTTEAM